MVGCLSAQLSMLVTVSHRQSFGVWIDVRTDAFRLESLRTARGDAEHGHIDQKHHCFNMIVALGNFQPQPGASHEMPRKHPKLQAAGTFTSESNGGECHCSNSFNVSWSIWEYLGMGKGFRQKKTCQVTLPGTTPCCSFGSHSIQNMSRKTFSFFLIFFDEVLVMPLLRSG